MTKPEWTHLYICVAFWLGIVGVALKLMQLSWLDYPRTMTYSRGADALAVALGTATAIFVWWLAWG